MDETRGTETHKLLGGKLNVYRREDSKCWQCSAFLEGRNWRKSTCEESLARAKDFAEDWFLGLKGKQRNGELKGGKSFRVAAAQFEREYEVITEGQRHPRYIKRQKDIIRLHLNPFFGSMSVREITAGQAQEYRIHRARSRKDERTGEFLPPARSTIHHEIVTLRQILKTAHRHQWLESVPDLTPPFKASGKISHRAWFSPAEYQQFYQATRRRAQNPSRPKYRWHSEQLHDYVLFMANTGLRPDEAARLEFRDVEIALDDATGETILEIEVRGKRGVGYCKSTANAVRPFERLKARPRRSADRANPKETRLPGPTDRLFPCHHRPIFNDILEQEGLKKDRDGNPRTPYSLRHTYICLRLMEGADIYQIAKNCRTSVEMIEKFYASHLKNTLDAAAINVRKSRKRRRRLDF